MDRKRVEVSKRGEAGSMYLELLVALTILAFALLAIQPMFILATRMNAAAWDMTLASDLAQEKAEELRQQSFSALTPGTEEDVVTWNRIRYQRSWLVETDLPQPGMKQVTVTVVPQRRITNGPKGTARLRYYRVP